MDRRLLRYYERELLHLRESASEFAQAYPKIAGRLAIDPTICNDPYVERLLEGFAFLTARVQVKLDAEFPRLTSHLLEAVFPQYLSPVPSMGVVQYAPEINDAGLAEGVIVKRGASLRSIDEPGGRTSVQYRTGQAVQLLPMRVAEASYLTQEVGTLNLPAPFTGRNAPAAVLRIVLEAPAVPAFKALELDDLTIYLQGSDQTPHRLYEQLLTSARGIIAREPGNPPKGTPTVLDAESIEPVGYSDDEAIMPISPRGFHGYRLLQEYFAFPRRFLFVRLRGLAAAVDRCEGKRLELLIPLSKADVELDQAVEPSNIALFCTPVINLFDMRAERIAIEEHQWEFQVLADRTRPVDYEVFDVKQVEGYGATGDVDVVFTPFYRAGPDADRGEGGAYFAVGRRPRALTEAERQRGRRSAYAGSEVFVSLVDAGQAPYRGDLRQLGMEIRCTNRHLPLQLSLGANVGPTDFRLSQAAPVSSIRMIAGPTAPRASVAEGDTAWRLVSHLMVNYLSIIDDAQGDGASGLRDLMRLYGDPLDPATQQQIEGLRTVRSRAVTRRAPTPGPIAFARGIEVEIGFDESYYEGTGIFVLGKVLEEFLARQVSINSFTETVIASTRRGVVKRWPARIGSRRLL